MAQPSIIALNADGTTDSRGIARVSGKSAAFSQRSTKPLEPFRGNSRVFAA
jgi:hypothetical protein